MSKKNNINSAAKAFAYFFSCEKGEAIDCHEHTLRLMVSYANQFIEKNEKGEREDKEKAQNGDLSRRDAELLKRAFNAGFFCALEKVVKEEKRDFFWSFQESNFGEWLDVFGKRVVCDAEKEAEKTKTKKRK
jgi:hypothetical protein